VLATTVLLLAVLDAASFAVAVSRGRAAWSNADPVRTVLEAEASLGGSIALAVWHWADPIRTVLLAEVSLGGEGGAAWMDAHCLATPTVFVAEPLCLGGGCAAWMPAHSLTAPTAMLGAESSCTPQSVGGATWCAARTMRAVLDAETACLGGGGAAWVPAHSHTAVSGAESSHTRSSVGGATRCAAQSVATVRDAEPSSFGFGEAAWMHAHTPCASTVLAAESV
jgi:hypothetical protein